MLDVEWLLGEEASGLLAEHAKVEATPAIVERLRRVTTPERAAAVLEQVELRRRAAAKFSQAARMLFTRRSLEQATDEWLAAYKAAWLLRHAAGAPLLDLCCGVGGDLAGIAAAGAEVVGVDRDAGLAAIALHNARLYATRPGAVSTVAADARVEGGAVWHADPDRRAAGRRTTQPELHEPSLATLESWRLTAPAAAIKLAPAARLPPSWEAECEQEWLSRGGECRQLVAWCGPLAEFAGKRRATRVATDVKGLADYSLVGEADAPVPLAPAIGRYVHEPDPAVIAAGLVGELAARLGATAWRSGVAYLTSDAPSGEPLAASFVVEEAMPLSRERLGKWLAERGVGRLEIKVRGVDVDPERLRKDLRPRGDEERTLIVAPAPGGDRSKAIVVVSQRVASAPGL